MATAKTEDTKEKTVAEAAPGVKVGDYIKFGSYYQENSSKKTPIEWLVLEKKEEELLLISRYGLDCRLYHHEYVDMTWEKCDLRKWLNNDFLNEAFTSDERKKIKVSSLINNDDDDGFLVKTKGGNSTQDRVFCLSRSEAKNYFKDEAACKCKATKYAASKNYCWIDSDASSTGYGYSYWWLRSSGPDKQRAASCVDMNGVHWWTSCLILIDGITVRPALRIIWNE
ncbi:MAG: hypothetical protein II922_00850 [Succinimonas sp.]|nr:hypothetical protein [Succinimonas sp.]